MIRIIGKQSEKIMKNVHNDYASNLDMLELMGAKKHYLETDDVTLVQLQFLRKAVWNAKDVHNVWVTDVGKGDEIRLKKRLVKNLNVFFDNEKNTNYHKKLKCTELRIKI